MQCRSHSKEGAVWSIPTRQASFSQFICECTVGWQSSKSPAPPFQAQTTKPCPDVWTLRSGLPQCSRRIQSACSRPSLAHQPTNGGSKGRADPTLNGCGSACQRSCHRHLRHSTRVGPHHQYGCKVHPIQQHWAAVLPQLPRQGLRPLRLHPPSGPLYPLGGRVQHAAHLFGRALSYCGGRRATLRTPVPRDAGVFPAKIAGHGP
jgi:hypothetical protein